MPIRELCLTCMLVIASTTLWAEPLAGTKRLAMEGDIAAQLVDGVSRFLERETAKSVERRAEHWSRDFTNVDAYEASVASNRSRLAHILGLRDKRPNQITMRLLATPSTSALVASTPECRIFAVRWTAFANVTAEGLLLVPSTDSPIADIVAVPDASQTPELIAGIGEGALGDGAFARRLAESGCRVLVPTLLDREVKSRNNRARMTNREFIYRSAFELGRHVIGYEVQKILAGVDWFEQDNGDAQRPIGVIGYGEGGMVALYAAALDTRLSSACVSGYFDSRQELWREPISRNVFGLLEQFGDAEIATLIAPKRQLIVEACRGPEVELPSSGGAPGRLLTPSLDKVTSEVDRANALLKAAEWGHQVELVTSDGGHGPHGSDAALTAFLQSLSQQLKLAPSSGKVETLRPADDVHHRQQRQLAELDRHNQALLVESAYVRRDFMKDLNTTSLDAFEKSQAKYRDFFANEVVGRFDEETLPMNPRTRPAYNKERWKGYEVVLDVFPDVIAYGILLLPKDLKPDERRPVVVCQHGLEGRPQQLVEGDHRAYHDFAAKLAERGFITFCPQNLYIGRDRFRVLQRKANPLKKSLFSVIVPQHQQIVDWLSSLPNVDPNRIAFYGLSYGGKSAMRIPPLVPNYCLSICSADFNEWVWKNASSRAKYSYVWTGEYEIFEFDLGSTFNYAEMATLIAPRPFMVERGHFDGVAPDETVGYEFAKVRHLYAARLKIPERCEIEWFDGPHTINGKGTFDFLHKHLGWPEPKK